ncbi:hypothetical protein GJ744_010019 [Endocarpon pusillum]|uniref:S-adenosyl-L-methionine-dependent N-methyltransferase n=1 Tax=Endocarpon pusillum TaxID=364733 RepID=A0A8H7AEY4_9EURO|nr:hypothetical protein GJ744_010019 [Endocarpon pusillum]
MELPSLIVLGPQTPSPSPDHLSLIRQVLLNDHRLQTFLAAIKDLPDLWSVLVEADPSLTQVPGLPLLEGFRKWINHGEFPLQHSGILPNVLSTPLTVIIQIVEYFNYLEHLGPAVSHAQILDNVKNGGFQGFCTGFLAAIALAYSKDEREISEFAAVALRLAVCIGAYVDLDGRFADPPRETSCITARWTPAVGKHQVLDILKDYPETYISVLVDMTSATVTVPKSDASSLMHRLAEKGVIAKPFSLSGRFHSPVHEGAVEGMRRLSMSNASFRFPANGHTLVPLRNNSNAEVLTGASLHGTALRSILTEQSNWYLTITSSISQLGEKDNRHVLMVGLMDCISQSTLKESNLQASHLRGGKVSTSGNRLIDHTTARTGTVPPSLFENPGYQYPEGAIAVVGMACRFAGADTVDEFWEVIQSGTSMLGELPNQRFSAQGLRRSPDPSTRFLGNFIRDADAFDHRFFKKSSREATSTDPQHRLVLQVAYETLESSGYFSGKSPRTDIGCYIGVAASDYEDNVASHLPTAFSVLGMVRAFASGKISHFFGLSGPSLVFDTACSSSAVAIHTACNAIRSGDCSMALAGGVNVITSPILHQNLAAANFLSPTGASKAFDAKADGYCRGEGAGLVLLKKLSSAIADNDNILGVLVGSALNQNDNCAPITVPVSPSQSNLYRRVLSRAGMEPREVSFVEAHGTGTPKGDPIECESIRQVFGGQSDRKLYFGSVKGSIGHTEAASGAAALIKTLLMMQHKMIPKQASFTTLNPNIAPLELSNMAIPTATRSWNVDFMAACINNYGAAGSNAAMIVCQPPAQSSISCGITTDAQMSLLPKYPIFISANSQASLQEYCLTLRRFLAQRSVPAQEKLLASVAFNLAHKQNHSFAHVMTTTAVSAADLAESLSVGASDSKPETRTEAKQIVLVFGGQTGDTISFCEEAYRGSLILRFHLDRCDGIIQSMGLKGLFPDIFKSEPIEDVVTLHCMLFSLQYACAQSWIDSGLQVKTVIGHSFGQLTALCVAGSLSLENGLKLVSGRAALIKSQWGHERGSMLSIDSNIQNVTRLITLVEQSGPDRRVEIACYNGPSSYVLVGTAASVDAVEGIIAQQTSSFGLIKTKRLNVTHGFHSMLVDSILSDYTKLVEGLTFNTPTIPIETCSEGESWKHITPKRVAQQSRDPVYFGDAVERIEQRLGPCTWVEAGSGTPAISMVRRALRGSTNPRHSFHPIKLSSPDPLCSLADTTVDLWKAGVKVQFWPFHRSQRHCYIAMNLPPYQFEKSRHWLDYVDKHGESEATIPTPVEYKPTLLSFVKFSDETEQVAEFTVDQNSEQYKACVTGHAVLASTLCPASLYIEIAARAATFLKSDFSPSAYAPHLEELEMYSPLGIDSTRAIQITLRRTDGSPAAWKFTLSSCAQDNPSLLAQHATGKVSLLSSNSARTTADFARYERLVNYPRCEALLADASAEAMQGSLVYKMFDKVVKYADIYRGLRRISSRNGEVAGHVEMPTNDSSAFNGSICHPLAVDNFTQVAGLHVNGLEDCGDNEVFVCTKIDQLQVGPNFKQEHSDSGPWLVYSNFDRKGDRELVNDIFVFDFARKRLVMTILGVRFTKVVISSLRKALSRANASSSLASPVHGNTLPLKPQFQVVESDGAAHVLEITARAGLRSEEVAKLNDTKQANTRLAVQKLLHEVAEIPMLEILDDASLEELGIDSLMATEVLNAIKDKLDVNISVGDFQDILDVKSLCQYIGSRQSDGVSVASSGDADTTAFLSSTNTPDTEVTSTPNVEGDEMYNHLVSKLSKLVAEHLDTTEHISRDTNLGDAGLDSLLGIELGSDIEKAFGVRIEISHLSSETTFGNLTDMILRREDAPKSVMTSRSKEAGSSSRPAMVRFKDNIMPKTGDDSPLVLSRETLTLKANKSLAHVAEDFASIRGEYGRFAKETGFADFRTKVYPIQEQLVLAYIVEAFAALGCSLTSLNPGDALPPVPHIPKHAKVMGQYYKVLEDAGLILRNGAAVIRTATPVNGIKAKQLYEEIIASFPQHRAEHRLLNSTGSKLADCLSGQVDPLQVLFRSKADKDLLEEVYTNSPMFATGTKILGNFYVKTFNKYPGPEKLRILELGAGTGGTTKHIIDLLISHGIEFTYTFTDLSSSMVAAAKKKFAHYDCMEYMVLDVEKPPPEELIHSYHTILSSNCVHATKNLLKSSINTQKMLRSDGFLCLLELTRNLYWLDCVFGLLEGWWLFDDGRKHVLADEFLWERTLLEAGFKSVDWSDDDSRESDQFRVIAAFVSALPTTTAPNRTQDQTLPSMETVEFHKVNETSLCADIYYPARCEPPNAKRPIALMIHGGGHIMLSRKDIRPKQTQLLLDNGLLPVSVDYRLCPEVSLTEGPIPDVCSALRWARHTLPTLELMRSDIQPDGGKVVVVGWSTGGTLSMTLAWTAPQQGLKPPEAILAFYCPTDYESDFYKQPNFPEQTASMAGEDYDLLEGIQEKPITGYNVPASKRAIGGWMSTSDPRSCIALHMNWRGQALPVLLGGLPSKSSLSSSERDCNKWLSLPQPDHSKIVAVSPCAQISRGTYRVPTFLIHGTEDDLIPWQQTQKTRDALVDQGVPAGIAIVEDAVHLFDLYRDPDGKYWQAVRQGYEFIFSHLRLASR